HTTRPHTNTRAREHKNVQHAQSPLVKPQKTKGRHKSSHRSPDKHKAKMDNAGADKQSNNQHERKKDNESDRADSHTSHAGKSISLVCDNPNRMQSKGKKELHNCSRASTDNCIDERLSEAAFAPHGGKRFRWSGQNHLQSFDKCAEKSFLLPVIPRQP